MIPDNSLLVDNDQASVRGEYTIDDIRNTLRNDGTFYQNLRIQCETRGTITYTVPVQDREVDYVISLLDGYIPRNNPFPVTKIIDSGLSDEDSIVVILMGDAFLATQYGNWPNPANGTVLSHALNAMNAKLSTHPFNLFIDYFSVYVVHVASNNDGTNGYLGTVNSQGNHVAFGVDDEI